VCVSAGGSILFHVVYQLSASFSVYIHSKITPQAMAIGASHDTMGDDVIESVELPAVPPSRGDTSPRIGDEQNPSGVMPENCAESVKRGKLFRTLTLMLALFVSHPSLASLSLQLLCLGSSCLRKGRADMMYKKRPASFTKAHRPPSADHSTHCWF
jgi:hypothetical protein